MKPEKNIDEILERYITTATSEDVEQHCNQMFERLQTRAAQIAYPEPQPRRTYWQRLTMVAVAAAVVLAAGIGLWWHTSVAAVITNVDGFDHAIRWDESVNSSKGTIFKLVDGSRVEMSAKAELTLEKTEDGVRIHLTEGNVIVNAAKQPAG